MSSKILENTLIGLSSAERLDFSVFSAENRSLWDSLPESVRKEIIRTAEECRFTHEDTISLSLFQDFRKTGNRKRLEDVYFAKRRKLSCLVIAECVDAPVDKESYDINRKIFEAGLEKIGYTFVKPKGAFYMWIKALEPDANAFYERAKAHELLLVPSDGFGVKGWVRAGYCCTKETIEGALGAFQELWDEYHA